MPAKRKRQLPVESKADTEPTTKAKRTKVSEPEPVVAPEKTSAEPQTSLSSLVRDPSWASNLQTLFNDDNFKSIEQFLNQEWSSGKTIFPPKNLIFEAFNKTPFDKVKVVLLGQDPYHDDGQVHFH